MSLLARAVNDAATAPPEAGAAAGESNHSTTANHTNHTTTLGDDTENADLETVSSLSSASVAPLSVSSAPAPRRRLFGQSGPAVGVMEEEGEEDDDELGSYPSIETDVSLAPLLAGVAVGGGGQGQGAGSRSGSAATTGSVGSSASSKGAAGASSNGAGAEGWSTVSQDGNVEGNEDVANSVRVGVGVGASGVGEEGGEKPVGRESASWAVEEEGGEGEDEALRQLRDKGFWFRCVLVLVGWVLMGMHVCGVASRGCLVHCRWLTHITECDTHTHTYDTHTHTYSDKMASLLPSTPSPLRGAATSDLAPPAAVAAAAGQKMMGKAPQE